MKLKMALCYNALIEKLGPKVKQFSNFEKLVQVVVTLLNEGALEVRNMAKIGLITLKNSIGNQRELDMILIRCAKDEKQLDKIRQILERTELESISVTGSTRYGSSMRTSSLDNKGASQYKNGAFNAAAGSDGFGKFT